MLCKTCYSIGKMCQYNVEKRGSNLYLFSCSNPNHVHSLWCEWTGVGWRETSVSYTSKKRLQSVTRSVGGGVKMFDGQRERYISKAQLQEVKSAVTTHEGEQLYGEKARKYMDNHSKEKLGKDLTGSYKSESVQGYA